MRRVILMVLLAILQPIFSGCGEKSAGNKIEVSAPDVTAKTLTQEEMFFFEVKQKADAGDVEAQFALGYLYTKGQGVPQDYAEAVKWYRLAAQHGSVKAQFFLGAMYAEGQGVHQDDAEAVKWFRLAAQQGDALAQFTLGAMYKNGRGVPQDTVRAHLWFNLAAASGEKNYSIDSRDKIAASMTSDQIVAAQKMAKDCQANKFIGCD